MASTVENLIAVINPEKYSVLPEDKMEAKKKIEEIKSQVKEKGLVIAAQKAKPKTLSEHKLVYECYTETLEPIYYWILDFLNDSGMEVQKIIDNFLLLQVQVTGKMLDREKELFSNKHREQCKIFLWSSEE
jgi:predicted N-acyltransferase